MLRVYSSKKKLLKSSQKTPFFSSHSTVYSTALGKLLECTREITALRSRKCWSALRVDIIFFPQRAPKEHLSDRPFK